MPIVTGDKKKPELVCPNCKADLKENLMFVEDGCTNYIHYKMTNKNEWIIDNEIDGENISESYYACRSCGEQLPDDFQDYFQKTI